MMLPERELAFPNGLVVPVRTVKLTSWQYHILKHPLGVKRDARSTGDDPEGWGDIVPPVVEQGWRAQVFSELSAIATATGRCELPEVHGKKPRKHQAEIYACHSCPEAVARLCERATHGERPVGQRYANTAQSVLDSLVTGVTVTRAAYQMAVARCARQPELVRGVSVLAIGTVPSRDQKLVAQFRRGDGLLLEFFVHQSGRSATWRTMYRVPCENSALLSFLLKLPLSTGAELSETCVVARQWWERHGI